MPNPADSLAAALARHGLAATVGIGVQERLRYAVFNGRVRACPLAVVACPDEAAVRAAMRVAADRGVPASVLAGGHDIAGRGFGADTLVLDCRPMSQVEVDAAAGEVTVGGAALTRDLLAALPDDLVAVTGTVLSVGVTGLTLAGGYGRLNSRFGLAADNLKRARVVMADGSLVTASASENVDLFWALRGGGTGFGVVTSLTLALHSLPQVWTAMVLVPLGMAEDSLLRAQDLIDRHPVDLSVFMGFMTPPGGEPMLFLAPLWSGDAAAAAGLSRELSVAGAQVVQEGWGPYRATFSEESEKAWPKGRNYRIPTRTLSRIDRKAAAILVEGAKRMASPHAAIVIHDFHGAPTWVAPEATAFPLRVDHYVVEVIGAWDGDPSGDGARHARWADDVAGDLAAVAIPGGYTNLLEPAEAERVRLFYGHAAERLRAVKHRVDPADLFRSGIGRLEPSARAAAP